MKRRTNDWKTFILSYNIQDYYLEIGVMDYSTLGPDDLYLRVWDGDRLVLGDSIYYFKEYYNGNLKDFSNGVSDFSPARLLKKINSEVLKEIIEFIEQVEKLRVFY